MLAERGEIAEARAVLADAGSPPPGSDQAILMDRVQMGLLLAEGRPAEALEHSEMYRLHAGRKRHPRYVPWRSLKAQSLDRLGRRLVVAGGGEGLLGPPSAALQAATGRLEVLLALTAGYALVIAGRALEGRLPGLGAIEAAVARRDADPQSPGRLFALLLRADPDRVADRFAAVEVEAGDRVVGCVGYPDDAGAGVDPAGPATDLDRLAEP